MYFIINNHLTHREEKIHTKRDAIAKVKELYDAYDALRVSTDFLKKNLPDKGAFCNLPDITSRYIVENCISNPYAIGYKNFDIRCVKEYELEGIEEQLFELDELTEPLFYYDQEFTFSMAIKWFKTTPEAKVLEDNPLGINWERVVKQDYNVGNFDYEYSDELVNMYIDAGLEKISQMSPGDIAIFNDLKVTCH